MPEDLRLEELASGRYALRAVGADSALHVRGTCVQATHLKPSTSSSATAAQSTAEARSSELQVSSGAPALSNSAPRRPLYASAALLELRMLVRLAAVVNTEKAGQESERASQYRTIGGMAAVFDELTLDERTR